MNKYLEMYKRLEDDWQNYLENKGKLTYEDMVLIKELVEKATPKKYISRPNCNNWFDKHCPKCDSFGIRMRDSYCSSCGQKLDWSE